MYYVEQDTGWKWIYHGIENCYLNKVHVPFNNWPAAWNKVPCTPSKIYSALLLPMTIRADKLLHEESSTFVSQSEF